jgi:HSP20 family protein
MYAAYCGTAQAESTELAARIRANVYENDSETLVELALPGFSKEEVTLEVSDRVLKVRAEKKAAAREGYREVWAERGARIAERSFRLGEDLEESRINARFENGLLLVTIAKAEKAQPKKVEIN